MSLFRSPLSFTFSWKLSRQLFGALDGASSLSTQPIRSISLAQQRQKQQHHGRLVSTKSSFSSSTTSSPVKTFPKLGVIGLGLMGHGILQVSATAAALSNVHDVVIGYEPKNEYLQKGRDRITSSIDKLVAKDKLTSTQAEEINQRIIYTTDKMALADVDYIVEAVIENMDLKRELYTDLGTICQPSTIFASNTSSLSITEMAHFSGRRQNFVGVHFFNPVQIMKLVEVIKTEQTSMESFQKAYQWVHDIGKVPVQCGDTPGFIVNRLLVPSLLQAMLMVDRHDATIRDIDLSLQLGAGHPMGPLHLADYIGLDTCLYIVQGWRTKYPKEPAFVLPQCLEQLVSAGHFGRKSGRGFYHWDGDKRGDPVTTV
jgi:3-hydroxyacyl-CoA dehydrogenase